MVGSLALARRRAGWVIPLLVAAGLITASPFAVAAGAKTAGPEDKVEICHRTNSNSNPYVQNSPSKSGDVNGHDGHEGPVWNPFLKDLGIKWGDIIPPFDYGDNEHYPGKNWDDPEGQAIYENGCKPVVPPAPEPPGGDSGDGLQVGGITAERPGGTAAAAAVTAQPRFTG
jgi:hypothetical protein